MAYTFMLLLPGLLSSLFLCAHTRKHTHEHAHIHTCTHTSTYTPIHGHMTILTGVAPGTVVVSSKAFNAFAKEEHEVVSTCKQNTHTQ